jgi:PIN domain nuclease of toxin-antitoxin system
MGCRQSVIVLDTHAWLWWVVGDSRLPRALKRRIEATEVGVCSISCFEIALLERRGRLTLDRNVHAWVELALAREGVRLLPLDASIATDAAQLDPEGFPGDPADRIIYATARRHGAVLATKDRRIRAHDATHTLW